MNYTQSIGNVVELKCITKFIEMGYEVSIPYGNGAKYDFIADINGELLKFQCKSASHPRRNGIEDTEAIQIITVCQTTNTQKTIRHTYTEEQIDYFATCYNDEIYIIPVQECSTSKTLRFTPPKNNQPYNNADDYKISNFFSQNEDFINSKIDFEKRKEQQQQEKEEKYYCLKCGKEITKDSQSGLCISCFNFSNRKIKDRPTREELKDMIRTMPFTTIGKNYGVSDNTIRKWCRAENLPNKAGNIKKYTNKEWEEV